MHDKIIMITAELSLDTPVVISPDGEGMPGCIMGIRNRNKTVWIHSKLDMDELKKSLDILKSVRDKNDKNALVTSFNFDPSKDDVPDAFIDWHNSEIMKSLN